MKLIVRALDQFTLQIDDLRQYAKVICLFDQTSCIVLYSNFFCNNLRHQNISIPNFLHKELFVYFNMILINCDNYNIQNHSGFKPCFVYFKLIKRRHCFGWEFLPLKSVKKWAVKLRCPAPPQRTKRDETNRCGQLARHSARVKNEEIMIPS